MYLSLSIEKEMKWKGTCFKDAVMPQQEKRVYSFGAIGTCTKTIS